MIRSLLVANRGEIALRIIRTARALGIRTVAIHSDADADAWHVAAADAAIRVGPAAARESYLDVAAVIDAAVSSGCDAVHPGYGFLAESAAFATACAEAGLVFVGPPVEAIRIMGSKDAARDRMIEAGVPVVPGVAGRELDADPAAAAAGVGFPLLVKAAAGGGGKGMRVVRDPAELEDALAGVRREALAAFGDDTLLLERWIERARHVEVQVFADADGRTIHLFDRDCSTQRRHQKVLEEAPAPDVPAESRAAMADAAVAAAQAVGYVGAGTVEFLLAGDRFFFLEMNTRLQVEHPVTEMVTGADLVAWQLRIAAGEPLPDAADALRVDGHAVEVRLYAEDPAFGFLPATGTLSVLSLPDDSPGVRVDAGVRQGDVVSPHYDPMIAKIAAHGRDREQALERLGAALAATRVHGVRTNLDLLRALVADEDLRRGPVHTRWLEAEVDRLLPIREPTAADLARAAFGVTLARAREADSGSAFATLRGFRLNQSPTERVTLGTQDGIHRLLVRKVGDGWEIDCDELRFHADGRLDGDQLAVALDGERERFTLLHLPDDPAPRVLLLGSSGEREFELRDQLAPALARDENAPGSLLAPMPGSVIAVHVEEGASVEAGDTLLVLEAMKMEHGIRAPHSGVVRAIHFGVGERVGEGAVLAEVEEADAQD